MSYKPLIAALIAGCCSLPANAQPIRTSRSVSLVDINLSSEAGRADLDRRLQRAAYSVCGAKSSGDGIGNDRIDNCRAETLAKARRDVEMRMAAGASTVRLAARSQ